MVKFYTSLLALTFATGLVLASSDDYERRDNELFERDLDLEEFFGRQDDLLDERSDAFDEFEARGLFGGFLKIGEEVGEKGIEKLAKKGAEKAAKKGIEKASKKGIEKASKKGIEKASTRAVKGGVRKAGNTAAKHGGSVRKTSTPRRIVKQLKPSKKTKKIVKKQLKHAGKHAAKEAFKSAGNNNQNNQNDGQNRANQDLQRARQEVADADRYLPPNQQYRVQSRGLEYDDEELSRRDLDVEEAFVFGREYD